MTEGPTGGPVDATLIDGVTHYDHETHVQTQAVLACVQQIYADEAWTVQVLAAAVIAEHQLDNGLDPRLVAETLKDGLKGRMIR